MKKLKGFLFIIMIFLITGCSSDITCKNSYNDLIKYEIEITANTDDENIVDATAKMNFKNSEDANVMCNIKKLVDSEKSEVICNDKQIIISNYQYFILKDKEKVISKKEFIKRLEQDGFKC